MPQVAAGMTRSADFSALMDRFGSALGRIAAAFEANPALREELLQEMMLAIWQALPAFRSQAPLRNYIFRIAHNRAVSHIALHARKPDTIPFNEELHTGAAHSRDNPERQLSQSQRSGLLIRALRLLPAVQRQLVMLSMEGFSYDEISEISGFSKTNVGVKLTRAKRVLKNHLGTRMNNEAGRND